MYLCSRRGCSGILIKSLRGAATVAELKDMLIYSAQNNKMTLEQYVSYSPSVYELYPGTAPRKIGSKELKQLMERASGAAT